MRVTYTGPHDAVDIDGRVIARDESIDIKAATAAALLEQPDNWVKTPTAKES